MHSQCSAFFVYVPSVAWHCTGRRGSTEKQNRNCATWRPPDAAPDVFGCFGQFCTKQGHKLLISSFRSNSGISIGFSDPDFLKESNNLAIRRRFHVETSKRQYIECHLIKICIKFEPNRTICGEVSDDSSNYVTLWPWPLTSWPSTFVVDCMSRDQTRHQTSTKSNKPRLNYWSFSKLLQMFKVHTIWPPIKLVEGIVWVKKFDHQRCSLVFQISYILLHF